MRLAGKKIEVVDCAVYDTVLTNGRIHGKWYSKAYKQGYTVPLNYDGVYVLVKPTSSVKSLDSIRDNLFVCTTDKLSTQHSIVKYFTDRLSNLVNTTDDTVYVLNPSIAHR